MATTKRELSIWWQGGKEGRTKLTDEPRRQEATTDVQVSFNIRGENAIIHRYLYVGVSRVADVNDLIADRDDSCMRNGSRNDKQSGGKQSKKVSSKTGRC